MGWWARLEHRRLLARMAGPKLLRAFAQRYPQAYVVEVGANDGQQHDHLRPYLEQGAWRGILVEPVPYVFARLQANYGANERLALVNAAIGEHDGERPFFHLREARPGEQLPHWYDGIGSFSREVVLSHAPQIPDIHERLVTTRVAVLSFDTLLARHGAPHVNLVIVDTEGSDWEVLRAIDLERHRPRMLVYEHFHLDDAVRTQARGHLGDHGYATFEEGFDTFCLDIAPDDALSAAWRRLRPAVAGVSKHDEVAS